MRLSLNNLKKHELDRLIIQAHCWEPETEKLFDAIGVQPGWKCVDLGCGPVGVLEPLSQRVGLNGLVIGVDEDPDCIIAAKDLVHQKKLNNVEIIKANIFENQLRKETFDFSHMRFVFNQKGCDQELLENMIALTQPGGFIVSQESDWTTWKCYPPQPSWRNLRDAMITLFERTGGDINAGLRTYQMFKQANLADIQIRTAILAMPIGHPYRSGLIEFALTMKDKILATNVLSETAFNQDIEDCREVIKNPDIIIFSYTLTQVWGRVNGH
jgi:ubiquinone/menaquinone biosynthesis C-methylase UbiE